jgi:hypothetical protein
MPSQAELHRQFEYRDGQLYYRTCHGTKHKGELVGFRAKDYWRHSLNGRKCLLHRIVWVYHNGPISPGLVIDHIDHNTFNNRIGNLRAVTVAENNRNQSKYRSSTNTPFTGVYKHGKSWYAEIHIGRKKLHLGAFATPELALAMRKDAERKLAYHPNHGKEKAAPEGAAVKLAA